MTVVRRYELYFVQDTGTLSHIRINEKERGQLGWSIEETNGAMGLGVYISSKE